MVVGISLIWAIPTKHIFPNGVTHDSRRQEPFPVFVTHALGSHKWDVEGHPIIDETVDGYDGALAEVREDGLLWGGRSTGHDLLIGGIHV